jgi:hypothetical protein
MSYMSSLQSAMCPHTSDAELAQSLAQLWPHRWHESNCLLNILCHAGLHRWMKLDLSAFVPDREVRFCFWCEKVKLDGVIYGDRAPRNTRFLD